MFQFIIMFTADTTNVDIDEVKKDIRLVLEKKRSDLSLLFHCSMKAVAIELFQAGMIANDVHRIPTDDKIFNSLLCGFAFQAKIEDIEEHCKKLFNVFQNMGGPFRDAADAIKQNIQENVKSKVGIWLNIDI